MVYIGRTLPGELISLREIIKSRKNPVNKKLKELAIEKRQIENKESILRRCLLDEKLEPGEWDLK